MKKYAAHSSLPWGGGGSADVTWGWEGGIRIRGNRETGNCEKKEDPRKIAGKILEVKA
jgi:hypothetical protein